MFQSHKILFPKTAHYYTLGKPSKSIKYFWIVCHGYGQLASQIIQKFEDISDEETFVVAPEGFSRFYWKRPQVGASWMTRENRLDEIEDYSRYLQKLYDEFVPQFSEEVQINLLGFSQGVATHCRWVMNRFPQFHNLILWAGLLPEDLNYIPRKDFFKDKGLYFVCGDQDQFIDEDRIKWHQSFAKEQLLNMEDIFFEGKHKIEVPLLKEMVQRLK